MAKIGRNAVRKGGVTLMVMDCVINFIRFMIPDQVYCNRSQKSTTICLKQLFYKTSKWPLPHFTQTLDCLALSLLVNVSVYVKREYMLMWIKTNNQIWNKNKCLVSFLHIHIKYLDLQARKKRTHSGVKAFDDYICTSVNVTKCIPI